MSDEKTTYVGPSLLTIVGVVFIILKLVGTVDWSWFWVLSPFYPAALIWSVIIVLAIIFGVRNGLESHREEKERKLRQRVARAPDYNFTNNGNKDKVTLPVQKESWIDGLLRRKK